MDIMRCVLFLLILLSVGAPAAAQRTVKEANAASGQTAARALRAEWELGDLKLTREAVDDTSFKPGVRSAAIEALESFIAQQEQLIRQVEQSPDNEARVRKQRAKLVAAFTQRMAVVYDDPQLKRELAASVKAVNREMDEMAESAGRLFARLEKVGLTAEQKQKLKPLVAEANRNVRAAVEKSRSKSTKDRAVREEVVDTFKESRKKVKQQLTPAQREKLKQTLAQE